MAGRIRQLFRLWRVQGYLDFLWMTRDTRFFLICFVSDTIINVGAVLAMLLVAARFDGIGPWTRDQAIFMLGYSNLARGIINTFCGFNILHISRRLGRGQLDHSLIIPLPLWLVLLTEGFTPFQSACTLLPGIALLCWSIPRLGMPVTAGWAALLLLNLLSSALIMVAVAFLWGSLAFWAPRGAEEITSDVDNVIEEIKVFPLDGLGPLLLGSLVTVLPIGMMAWYPSQALLGLRSVAGLLITPLLAIVWLAIAAFVFSRGLRHYVNTGSSRYTDYGHRR